MRSLHIVIFFFVFALFSCKKQNESTFAIPFSENEIKVDGIINEDSWQQAVVIENFYSPWEENNIDKTKFKSFVSPNYFNFSFQVEDSTLLTIPFEKESDVAREDRVELFFSSDTTLSKYYCIEMDPNGNKLDYSAKTYRNFDDNWDFKSAKLAAKITEKGYIVEGQISLKELKEIGISNDFYIGIFRADFKSDVRDDVTWFSWVKPNSSDPDFHIASVFRKIILKE